ncbi:phenylalanine--tRNA ligase subunit alpha [Enterobacteriaceae endosymbiont of Plateumaris consimilis]|uniref:phenylalanine--tRNA ligase subunit alpha n=1 Tax=Enterobacteriaceae endosymbiont of Plateumaris consimilis TaxID=2675794 RepID=UPI001448EB66|nr:phenylalanine--tRNA ligase subunit alpha [Enterobacteriaceae endosymbiont of Plateumaris consimilis]QJC28859.1 phenylalanine--tRNA ligase subunit alpha [Enterobacteriaceae endosymbiont of Plateumaris consimilis]
MSDLNKIIIHAKKEINLINNIKELNIFKTKYLGKKGYISSQFLLFKKLTKQEKIKNSTIINNIKKQIKELVKQHKNKLESNNIKFKVLNKKIDITLPGRYLKIGSQHPINTVIYDIENFFIKLGFKIIESQEIEDTYHNFDALNISENHPSRTKQDTFWLNKKYLLRTQTSNMQIRMMKILNPPIRILTSGKVYRNDYDKKHTPMFHQIEGLLIDNNINFLELKEILSLFLKYFFDSKLKIRFRPSYFPFTEPSLEVDIMGTNNKWIEVLGAGMVHPNVLSNININLLNYSGCAFGVGVERLAMLRYNIHDIRLFFENDIRFLKQFK